MAFSDNFFKKIEQKTKKLQESNMKDEETLKEVIHDISRITGREVSKEKEDKIINTIINDGVPKDFNKYLDDQN